MAEKYIYIKMVKEWGGFPVGAVVRFGYSKGQGRIEAGEGVEVPKQRAVNDPPPVIRSPAVETATAEPAEKPAAEKTVVTPIRRAKTKTNSE